MEKLEEGAAVAAAPAREKLVYFFGPAVAEGDGSMRDVLGGKGANLAEMSRLGLPVPPGFTISARVCAQYHDAGLRLPRGLEAEIRRAMARIEELAGKRFGDERNPLLVSVRSGAKFSMPGMMDTILNLGLNDRSVEGLAALTGDRRFAFDAYRRLVQMYGSVVLGLPKEDFERLLSAWKRKRNVVEDTALAPRDLERLVEQYKDRIRRRTGQPFPQDPWEQLLGAIGAVFESWNNERARLYRRQYGIPDDLGTAVNVQAMVFGNLGEDSATGVAFTRDPSTGDNRFYGEYLPNAQGEDVVAGIRTPWPLSREQGTGLPGRSLEERMPDCYRELLDIRRRLEDHYRDMQDIEFTIEKGRLYMLQTRTGKRTGLAALRIAFDLLEEGRLDEETVLKRIEPEMLTQLLAPVFDEKEKGRAARAGRILGRGLAAGPGAASGLAVFTADRAVELARRGKRPLLVREETSPEDLAGMVAAAGILTSRGGMTSHAAVVARGMGKPCVVGAEELDVDVRERKLRAGGITLEEGDEISIDGTTGEIIAGALPTRPSEIQQVLVEKTLSPERSAVARRFLRLMEWADRARKLRVRANADTPHDAALARAFGAEGIGLCRTEHMFFAENRIAAVRSMILAEDERGRRRALARLLPMQRRDFEGIFKAMDGLPVTIRLLDPPLHEFLPTEASQFRALSRQMGVPERLLREKAAHLREVNPMLGHRGCRLGLTYPEIYEMQVRAILEAAASCEARGIRVLPEIMIPLVGSLREFTDLRGRIEEVAREVAKKKGRAVPFTVGTMMEVPRACLIAEPLGREADFFSFGTNDLTQMTFGFSRDDIGKFLPRYLEQRILPRDPFEAVDEPGVGRLVRLAIEEGRRGNPALKIGVCGEHGGDPTSVGFFHRAGLDYVSCSPYRIPVARLAAAHAALAGAGSGTA
jgi:pyruvate,orthophosphate dikinase